MVSHLSEFFHVPAGCLRSMTFQLNQVHLIPSFCFDLFLSIYTKHISSSISIEIPCFINILMQGYDTRRLTDLHSIAYLENEHS